MVSGTIIESNTAPASISMALIVNGCDLSMFFLLSVVNKAAKAALIKPVPIAAGYEMFMLLFSGSEKLINRTPTITTKPMRMSFLMNFDLRIMGSIIAAKNEADPRQASVIETEFPSLILP